MMAVEVAHTLLVELDGAFSPSLEYQVGNQVASLTTATLVAAEFATCHSCLCVTMPHA